MALDGAEGHHPATRQDRTCPRPPPEGRSVRSRRPDAECGRLSPGMSLTPPEAPGPSLTPGVTPRGPWPWPPGRHAEIQPSVTRGSWSPRAPVCKAGVSCVLPGASPVGERVHQRHTGPPCQRVPT